MLAQEALIAGQPERYDWPDLDERSASSLCYTSGTTGEPKGVLYSHRSTVLHGIATLQKDVFNIGATDVVMPVVPMFHVNAWGIPYSAGMAGASLVLPGPKLDPASLHRLFEEERVTFSAGVPTIWTALLQWLRADPSRRFANPPRLVVGGTALPQAINAGFLKEYGVNILHAWGMTETSPLGATNARKPENADWDSDRFLDYARKQGRPLFGTELRVRDAAGEPIPHDGVAFGELEIRGPWIAGAYFNRPDDPAFTEDGWFRTGDVVTVDELGTIEIVDRAKDVIKSGGEWISSITLENLVMGHPAVQEAAVIAVKHAKWDERPLLLVVPKPDASPTAEEILGYLRRQGGEVVGARCGGVRGRVAAHRHRQAVEGRPQEALPGPRAGLTRPHCCAGGHAVAVPRGGVSHAPRSSLAAAAPARRLLRPERRAADPRGRTVFGRARHHGRRLAPAARHDVDRRHHPPRPGERVALIRRPSAAGAAPPPRRPGRARRGSARAPPDRGPV